MSRKVIISIITLVVVILGAIALPKISLYLKSRKEAINGKQVVFFIKSPTDLKTLVTELKTAGVVEDLEGFIAVAEYKGLNKDNIALGKYIIEPHAQYRTILNGFKLNAAGNGNGEVEVDVTFNNCRDIYELAGKVCGNIMLDSAKLVAFLGDESTLKKYGFTREELPSLFLPNTYKMYFDTDEKVFIDRMANEYKEFWTNERLEKLKKVGLNRPSQAVTLASIVYSEQARHSEEWPVIAGLYLNRINQGIKLQSDPTFKFCWGDQLDGVQRLLNVHRDIVCEYNTYKINGLPPGPICIPPSEVVDAVLNRTDNKYIFMMAKPDYSGLHDFAIDYSDHERFAKIYQKWLANEMKNQ
jgi:UPF0755 protein